MKHIKFKATTNKKSPIKHFNLSVAGQLEWPCTENPTRKEIIDYIKELTAKEFSRPDLNLKITSEMISVKLSA